jgi:hypothetical protein
MANDKEQTMTLEIAPLRLRNSPPAINRNKGGRPAGSPNRYTGALKELFLLAAET